jgi:Peptidase family M23
MPPAVKILTGAKAYRILKENLCLIPDLATISIENGSKFGVEVMTVIPDLAVRSETSMSNLACGQSARLNFWQARQWLLVVGLGSFFLGLGVLKAQMAGALDAEPQVASGSTSWRTASFPVENFLAYTSPFGRRSSATGGGGSEFHRGLDMAAPQGSYIRNWWTGRVVEVSDNSSCGTSVVVQSGDWTHIYCHMEGHVSRGDGGLRMIDRNGGIMVAEGQMVQTGQRIGRVGMSGRTTGPHLHWGLKHSGNWVDPARVLQAMFSQQSSVSMSSR